MSLLLTSPDLAGVNLTYTIRKVALAVSYDWVLPQGMIAVHPNGSGVNDTIINVTFDSSFNSSTLSVIYVSAISELSCSSYQAFYNILSYKVRKPSYISGVANVCVYIGQPTYVTYQTPTVPQAVSYRWTLPAVRLL